MMILKLYDTFMNHVMSCMFIVYGLEVPKKTHKEAIYCIYRLIALHFYVPNYKAVQNVSPVFYYPIYHTLPSHLRFSTYHTLLSHLLFSIHLLGFIFFVVVLCSIKHTQLFFEPFFCLLSPLTM